MPFHTQVCRNNYVEFFARDKRLGVVHTAHWKQEGNIETGTERQAFSTDNTTTSATVQFGKF
jgi:hypothetical protein